MFDCLVVGDCSPPPPPSHTLFLSLSHRCSKLAGLGASAVRGALAAAVREALGCAPSLVVLDDLDMLAPSGQSGGLESDVILTEQLESSQLAEWLAGMVAALNASASNGAVPGSCGSGSDGVACSSGRGCGSDARASGAPPGEAGGVRGPATGALCCSHRVALVATAKDAAGLHPALRQAGVFDCEVRLPQPGAAGRAALMAAGGGYRPRGVAFGAERIGQLASAAEGYACSLSVDPSACSVMCTYRYMYVCV